MISTFTEITDDNDKTPKRGWVLYDGECVLCSSLAVKLGPIVERRGFFLAPLQEPWVIKRLGLNPNKPPEEMIVLTQNDQTLGGVDAYIHLSKFVWWSWPFYVFAKLPGARPLLRPIYRWIAKNRFCIAGKCELKRRNS